MKIRITHPHLAEQLVHSLNETDCLAAPTSPDCVDVFVPWLERGGDPNQARMELIFFVRAWGLTYPGFDVRLD